MTIKYKENLRLISEISNPIITQIALKRGFKDVRFLTNWTDIVGTEYADIVTPHSLKHDSLLSQSILFLYTKDIAFASRFGFYKEQILARIKKYFGTTNITDAKILR